MDVFFSNVEHRLFQLVRQSLAREERKEQRIVLENAEWDCLMKMAERQGVLSLLYEELYHLPELPEQLKQKVKKTAEKNVQQQYHLLFLDRYIVELLMEHQIPAVVMKGVTIGEYYPIPELRKSGDVDLLLVNPSDLEKAKEVMRQAGYQEEEQHALHHVCFSTPDGVEVELHTMLAEPFDNEKTNKCLKEALEEAGKQIERMNVMGMKLPVLPKAHFAFELLLHMLQHFLRSGFGLKLLCDWVAFLQKELTVAEQKKYMELVENAGIRGFSDIVTLTCVQFLGLSGSQISWMNIQEKYPVEDFLREILDAEEFGTSNKNRMVVMRGTGLFDYVREFHHQMHLNFPKAGRCILLWPVLWFVTLVRFLRNNRKLRKVSTKSVLREASRRSRLMKKIQLFH